jgi:hypothetical protein
MSEAVRKHSPAPEPAPEAVFAYADPLPELLPPVGLVEVNDNEHQPAPREGERIAFEIPSGIWATMIACYGVFLTALLCATSGAHALFVIVVSTGYVAMFFGLTKVVLRHGPIQPRSVLDRGGELSTIYGPLTRGEVMAQMLVVPLAIAFFGAAVLIVSLAVR